MLFVFAALASAQASTAALEPSAPWTLSSQDDGCTVGRAFDNDPPIQIGFQTTMQARPAFLLIRGPNKSLPDGIGETPLALDDADPIMVHFGSFDTSDSRTRLIKLFPDDATMERLAKSTRLAVGTKMPPLHITGVDAAIRAIDKCTSDKLVSWGVDPSLYFQQMTATMTGDFAAMFDKRNYPEAAREKGVFGRVVILLNTDKYGAIAGCKVLTSPDPSLDTGTCDVAKRGRLKPPLGPTGESIASFAVVPVFWTRP